MKIRPKLTRERPYDASPEEVWEVLTTAEGIEAVMGPDGFRAEVEKLDLRPGGELVYTMAAIGPEQIEYLTRAGLALVTRQRVTFVEVDPHGGWSRATSLTSFPELSRTRWRRSRSSAR